jgi:hypothetical protein
MKRHQLQHPGGTAARLTVETPDTPDPVKEIDYVRWLSQMQADVAQSLGGIMLQAARPVPVGSAPGGTLTPLRSPGRLVGWSLHESSGTNPALVRLWDGREAGAKVLGYVALTAGQADNKWNAPGVSITDALLIEVVTGTVEGVVYLGGAD